MNQTSLFVRLEKGLRLLAGIALALMLFQSVGVLTYLVNVWPRMSLALPAGVAVVGFVAVTAALARSSLWIMIYWKGARVLSTLRAMGDSTNLAESLVPILRTLTRLLVASCILEFLLLPAIFLMDSFFPFRLSSVQLGMVQLASMLIPQAFGLAALALAYVAHQYGQLVQERCELKRDLELTI